MVSFLELGFLNYPCRGTTLQASLVSPPLIVGLWQEQLDQRLLARRPISEASEILLQASKLAQQRFDIRLTPKEEKNAKGNRSSTSIETANQARRREGGTDSKGLRDGGMEWKSKTDLMLPCLVCHGTLAAPDPTPASSFSAPHRLRAHMHAFVLPVS